jgi:hypothetical protein
VAELLHDGRVLAPVELACGPFARGRGVLGRERLEGVLALRSVSVHTVGVRFPIDVVCCRPVPGPDDVSAGEWSLLVGAVRTLPPGRITRPRWYHRVVLEAAAGSFGRWGVGPGDRIGIRR